MPEKQKLSERLGSGSDDVGNSDGLSSRGVQNTALRDALSRVVGGPSGGLPPPVFTQQASG